MGAGVVSAWRGLAVALAAVAAAGVLSALAFPDRTDYLGHFLAGAGGTLALLAPTLWPRRRNPWWTVAVVAVAVLLGVGTEATVFLIARFDPVDLAQQSLGALLVGAGVVGARGDRGAAVAAVVGALVLLAAGFHYAFA